MNIRGTDSTALPAVTDLFGPSPAARQDNGQGFARALQPAPAPPAPPSPTASSTPARRDYARPAAPAKRSANSAETNRESAAQETPANQSQSSDEQQRSNTEATDEQSDTAATCRTVIEVDQESTEPELLEGEEVAQALVAAQQLAREQRVKDPQPVNPFPVPHGEGPTPVTDAPPVTEAPAPLLPSNPAVPTVVGGPSPVVNATDAAAAAIEIAASAVAAAPEPQAQASEEAQALAVQPDISSVRQNSAAVLPQNGTQANTRRSGGAAPASAKGRTHVDSSGTAPSPDPSAAAVPVASADSASDDREPADDGHGRPRQVAGADPDQVTASPNTITEVPTPPTATNNLPPADAPPIATAPDSAPPPSAAQNQAGTTSALNPAVNPAAAIIQRLPAHALVRHAGEPQPDGLPVQVDSARFLQRVARAFESARERGGEIRLRLSPPELGALTVEVKMQEQGLVARVEVETPEARAALIDNLPILRERLAEQNLRIERFDVELSQRESPQHGRESADQQSDRQGQSQPRQPRPVPTRQPIPQTIATQVATPAGMQERRLNVIV